MKKLMAEIAAVVSLVASVACVTVANAGALLDHVLATKSPNVATSVGWPPASFINDKGDLDLMWKSPRASRNTWRGRAPIPWSETLFAMRPPWLCRPAHAHLFSWRPSDHLLRRHEAYFAGLEAALNTVRPGPA